MVLTGMLRTWSICVGECVLDEIVSGTEGHLSLSVHTQTLVATSVTLTPELLGPAAHSTGVFSGRLERQWSSSDKF